MVQDKRKSPSWQMVVVSALQPDDKPLTILWGPYTDKEADRAFDRIRDHYLQIGREDNSEFEFELVEVMPGSKIWSRAE